MYKFLCWLGIVKPKKTPVFKKLKEKLLGKRLKFKTESFNVGKVKIRIALKNGEFIHDTRVFGKVEQAYYQDSFLYNYTPAFAGEAHLSGFDVNISNLMNDLNSQKNFYDKNSSTAYLNTEALGFTILEHEDYFTDFEVAEIEEYDRYE